MSLDLYLGHPSHRGPVFIGISADRRFHVVFRGESLGAYATPEMAIEDAAGGHVFTPSDGTDLGALGLSAEIGDWLPARTLL